MPPDGDDDQPLDEGTPGFKAQWPSTYKRSRTPSPKQSPQTSAGSQDSPAVRPANWAERLTHTLQPALRVFTGGDSSPQGRLTLPESLDERPRTRTPTPSLARHSSSASRSPPGQGDDAGQGDEGSVLRRLSVPTRSSDSLSGSVTDSSAGEARRRTALLTWGLNSSGQLGFGDFATRILPRAVDYFKATRMAGVVCGSRTTFVLDAEGKVFSFGKGEDGALGIGDRATAMTPRLVETLLRQPIAQLKCRGAHVLALTARGQLWAWGRNEDGQLGYTKAASGKPREHHNATPERVPGLMGTRVLHVACGRCHSIAVDKDGRLYSWGGNDDGALGHGDRHSRSSPTLCEALAGMVVVGVACGSRHTLALVRAAPMLEGGGAEGRASPPSPTTAAAADAGGGGSLEGACVYSWGWGVYGQLGHGDVENRLEPCAVEALSELPVAQLACGYRHSMVVSADEPREVLAWGWGHDGQLGTGSLRDAILPQVVSGLPQTGRIELRLGGRHSLALCDGGRVYAWGKDDDGQLGLGVQSKAVPTRIDALRSSSVAFELVDAHCGWAHTALLVSFPEPRGAVPSDGRSGAAGSGASKEPAFASLKRRQSMGDIAQRKHPRLFAAGDFEGLFGQVRRADCMLIAC